MSYFGNKTAKRYMGRRRKKKHAAEARTRAQYIKEEQGKYDNALKEYEGIDDKAKSYAADEIQDEETRSGAANFTGLAGAYSRALKSASRDRLNAIRAKRGLPPLPEGVNV